MADVLNSTTQSILRGLPQPILGPVGNLILAPEGGFGGGGGGGDGPDPYFADVSLLVHGNGADASTSFPDSSSKNHTVTPYDDAQIDTAQSKFGGSSILFDGATDWLSVPYVAADFDWSAEPHTIEMWIYSSDYTTGWQGGGASQPNLIGRMAPTAIVNYWSFGPRNDQKLAFYYFTGGVSWALGALIIPVDQWNHIAMTYDGTDIRLFLNGVLDTTTAKAGSVQSVSENLTIGSFGGIAINGWVDDIRITRGVARYTSNFTPPTAQFPDS